MTESGLDVTVVPTEAALRFVGEATWSALSGKPVSASMWDDVAAVPHVRLGQQADLVVIAPATADLLARAAHGIADDLLTNVLLTARCPVLMAPAMHTEMWQHAATMANVAALRDRGVIVLDPDSGRLTGADSGPGRLPEPSVIADAARDLLRRRPVPDLQGRHIVVSAGGTREAWDPVRFIGNHSSGRKGVELARTALARGAEVTLVAAHMQVEPPAGVRVIRVDSAAQLHAAMRESAVDADVVVMAAAVADFRPVPEESKVKKDDSGQVVTLRLERTDDILADLVAHRGGSTAVIVGFAAETARDGADLARLGVEKLARKGCDLLVVNDVAAQEVFGSSDNAVLILGADGSRVDLSRRSKAEIADGVWDAVVTRLTRA